MHGQTEETCVTLILYELFTTACRQLFKKAQLLGYTTGQVMCSLQPASQAVPQES